MTKTKKPMRDFSLEVFFSKWEFAAKYHMTASDLESMTLETLLSMATAEQRSEFNSLWLGYTETWGAPELRREIAQLYERLDAKNVLCMAGAGEGIYSVSKCILGPEDHAIVPTPNYQSAETVPLSICDVTGVPLLTKNTSGNDGWFLDIEAIKNAIRPNTKLLSLNFPHNPTGMLINRAELNALISLCRAHDIYILSDEVYRGVELDLADQMPQIADLYEKGISLNVVSKAYGLPGLRIGWVASQDLDILQKIERYKHFLSICNSAPSESLALIAIQNREAIFAKNRALMMENVLLLEALFDDFPSLIQWQRPKGGCVAFPKYTGPDNVDVFCQGLLEKSGVLLLPASIYVSDLTEVAQDCFRIGFGRGEIFKEGVSVMRQHFEQYYADYAR
ncbi:aminotransferase class I/II-fold pyridoxal phosphate-dependent enzyme [Marinomonas sp. 15G1-11]|uniref:Aminotransferase class I/II-fold pyridoxal phosphate-dependent enzyme n=1 Tax=Marinomonas phaeophyticola TaxID=3004091 RepID=A0ABT4JPJ0_9GAMM|nr:aminotransferase class I/II-fold pyridoxal phosphate-dependent enzyme [Marinomonas sp. 15G1-11]MCZ2720283.1 aminotransferase class I/II-fold pyridoxal phosphate-dependent enzyme [Marinomonas sp. 15G1-11]